MSTVFDYIKWRGDLSFSDIRPGEVDSMAFSMVSYIDYKQLCGDEIKTIRQAAEGYLRK